MNHHHHQQIASEVRIQKARTTLLLDHPFFGTLLFRLGAKPSRMVATMATNGISLFYNPEFVETLNACGTGRRSGSRGHASRIAASHAPRRPEPSAMEHGLRLGHQPHAARCRSDASQRRSHR